MYIRHERAEKDIPGFGYWGGIGKTDLGISYGHAHSGEDPKDPRHYRKQSTVYFIVTKGVLILEIDGEIHRCDNTYMYELKPETVYRVLGSERGECIWIAINTVNQPGDKVMLEEIHGKHI